MQPSEWKAGWVKLLRQAGDTGARIERAQRRPCRVSAEIIILTAIVVAGLYCMSLYLERQYEKMQQVKSPREAVDS